MTLTRRFLVAELLRFYRSQPEDYQRRCLEVWRNERAAEYVSAVKQLEAGEQETTVTEEAGDEAAVHGVRELV